MSNDEIEIELLTDNISGLLRSEDVISYMQELAEEIKGRCSGSYEIDTFKGSNRANVSIYTTDRKTFGKNLKDNELLKALR